MSVAHQRTPKDTREQRGIAHGREYLEEIWRIGRWTWRIPSSSDLETVYIVTLKLEYYPCAEQMSPCKHLYAATYVKAKTATCDGCRGRSPHRELTELHEDNHDNLR